MGITEVKGKQERWELRTSGLRKQKKKTTEKKDTSVRIPVLTGCLLSTVPLL